MTTPDFLRLLREKRITLFIGDRGRLRYRGPKSAFTPFIRATLNEYMPEIIDVFNERAAIMEYDGGLARSEAERRAVEHLQEGRA